jgi:hydrogenase maturation protein HypF
MHTFTFISITCIVLILKEKSVKILVTGLVQGVGFRPFVYRIAHSLRLTGWVQNTNENVQIEVTGPIHNINSFLASLSEDAPSAAKVENISVTETEFKPYSEFSIRKSYNISDEITEISPDIAVCDECLLDIEKPGNRKDYAFVNCTNCGPRFTIIEDLPYDRAMTTMKSFEMCPACRHEYRTITDRRFHAQPVACNDCGPQYELIVNKITISNDIETILDRVSNYIITGGIVLLKGLGGMHLACDAFNKRAIEKLRNLKKRDGKPFAIMFRDIASLKQYADVNTLEEKSLLSWKRPIVLLGKKRRHVQPGLPENLTSGLNLVGVMLPYMPLHYMLFKRLKTDAIVLTSGNFSNEPILIENVEATANFSSLIDAIVLHNREIFNRTDDSVVRIIDGKERIFRRSRGYAPAPVRTALNVEGIVAFGAELTNCFCIGKGEKAFLSQHIGDLQSLESTLFYEKTIAQFIKLFRIRPSLLTTDMHPDYISTRTGLNFGLFPVVMVQHHHAHIASCMAEHGLDEKVIGVALDGTGYGTDGNIWGSEFMVCDLNDFERITHFEYIPLPGGDTATEEPWRIAVSWLYKVYGRNFLNLDIPLIHQIDDDKIEMILMMIDRKINCPLTSGAGRLFDAVASLLGLIQVATFQAEGPMKLESLAEDGINESYQVTYGLTIGFDNTIRAIIDDILNNVDKVTIATKLHNTIILTIFDSVNAIRSGKGINKVILSGGVFQNKYLLTGTTELLQKNKFEVYSHASVPTNDGGIALGQLAVASKRRELKCV